MEKLTWMYEMVPTQPEKTTTGEIVIITETVNTCYNMLKIPLFQHSDVHTSQDSKGYT